MYRKMTRRKVFKTIAASAGILAGFGGTKKAIAWDFGPDENLIRDLTPGPTPVRLGSYLVRRENEGLTEMVKRIREGGYTGVKADRGNWESIKDSELMELRAALREYDVVVFEIGGYVSIVHPVDSIRRENLKKLTMSVEIADKLDCPCAGTISGGRDPDFVINVHPDNWTKETWKLLVDGMKQVLRDTAGMKAAIGMEAVMTSTVNCPKSHRKLIDDVGDPRSAVNLDPFNMVCLANYYHTTELINECFDLLGESILGCHAKDNFILPDRQTVNVVEVCAGRGIFDYESYLVLLSRMKWARTLLPEHIPADQYPEAYDYIRKVAAKVGVKIHGEN